MNENNPNPQPSFAERFGNAFLVFLSAILRLLVILILGVAFAAIFYFGVPALYRQIVDPIQENAAQLQVLSTLQSQNKEQVTQRLESLTSRVESLENQADANREAMSSLETQLSEEVNLQKSGLSEMDAKLTSSIADLDNLQTELDNLSTTYKDLAKQVNQTGKEIEAMKSEATQEEPSLIGLQSEVDILKVMELLTRSRLYIFQSNFGLAERDVRAAREILVLTRTSTPDFKPETIQAVLTRLDLALANLPNAPNLANDDLEIAWLYLIGGLPLESIQTTIQSSEVTEVTSSTTPTLTGTQSVTSTPILTSTPTP